MLFAKGNVIMGAVIFFGRGVLIQKKLASFNKIESDMDLFYDKRIKSFFHYSDTFLCPTCIPVFCQIKGAFWDLYFTMYLPVLQVPGKNMK